MWWAIGYAATSVAWGFAVLWHWEYLKAQKKVGYMDEDRHMLAGMLGSLVAPLGFVVAAVVVAARATRRIPQAMAMRAMARERRWKELQAIQADVDRELGARS